MSIPGFVIHPARLASSNAPSTGEATSGVSRDHITPSEMTSLGYDIIPSTPVEPYADMYRAAVTEDVEYLLWAATTSSLSTLETLAFVIQGDPNAVTPATGDLPVGEGIDSYTDGTNTFWVRDPSGRDIGFVTLITVRSQNTLYTFGMDATVGFTNTDPSKGQITLTVDALAALGGGFSVARGDQITSVSYVLSGPKFWWSRNDSELSRFGWNGSKQRWEPFKCGLPTNLGPLVGNSYKLSPPPTRFLVGELLDPSLLRIGPEADALSASLSVLVVPDENTDTYPTEGLSYNGVVGVTNGLLLLNPSFQEENKGLTIWYNPESFNTQEIGFLGSLKDLPRDTLIGQPILSPIPEATDRPFLRIGNRSYLTPVSVATDAALPLPVSIPEGTFYWSRETGKVVLSLVDLDKATPSDMGYQKPYLGANLYSDGIALSTEPLEIASPMPVVNEEGEPVTGNDAGGAGVTTFGRFYIPRASPLPPPGASGVLWVPDGTGTIPQGGIDPQTRPVEGCGLVRQLESFGDTFLFSSSKAFSDLKMLEYNIDLPATNIRIKKTEVQAAIEQDPMAPRKGSRIEFKRRGLDNQGLYFVQAQVTPSVYASEARILAKKRRWSFTGTEVLPFAIDGHVYLWSASSLPPNATPTDIVNSFNAIITSGGRALLERGRLVLEAEDLTTGSVEIGWNADQTDLSGHIALGFLPGWRVASTFRWLPDTGVSFGLFRSPQNLDRSNYTADFKAVSLVGTESPFGLLLTDSISNTPYVRITNPPLEDMPGFDVNVHFTTLIGLNQVRLSNWGVTQGIGVKYEWDESRFAWTQEGSLSDTAIEAPTSALQLPYTGVFPETVSSAAMGTGYGLYLQKVGDLTLTEIDNFLLPGEGSAGQAVLIQPEGAVIISGGGGVCLNNSFTNPVLSTDPLQNSILQLDLYNRVVVGYLLQIVGGGIYTVTDKTLLAGEATFEVSPSFTENLQGVTWKVYEAQLPDVYDPTVLADFQQVAFNHLQPDPWIIRELSPLGIAGEVLSNAVVSLHRDIAIRFGLTDFAEIPATFLSRGLVCTGMLIPNVSDVHFQTGAFQLRVGVVAFNTTIGNLTLVSAFTGDVNKIEVGLYGTGIEGQIRIGSALELDSLAVYYDQTFLDLPAGQAEVNPLTGAVNLSSLDVDTYAGKQVFFVETLQADTDVVINPLNGSFYLNTPLREWQTVETEYYQADTNGDKIPGVQREYLPLTVRLETATPIDLRSFSFNPTGRTVGGGTAIWVGSNLQNFAGRTTAVVKDNVILLERDTTATVKINYNVFESFGGEQTFTVSKKPVYRKPFYLEAGQSQFFLAGDRSQDVLEGQLLLIGAIPFYVQSVTVLLERTEVNITPTPAVEVGSRSPGNEALVSLSNAPIKGAEGLLLQITQLLQPVNRGRTEIVFAGDVTLYAKAGHLLEIADIPYVIQAGALSADGRYTSVTLTSPTYTSHTSADTVYISVRKVYSPNPTQFEGLSPYVPSENYHLFLLGSRDYLGTEVPGKELVEGVDYFPDPSNGDIRTVAALQPWERLVFGYTALTTLSPAVIDDAVITPKYKAKFLYLTTPSKENGLLGTALAAKYVARNPDTFFLNITSLQNYMSDVSSVALSNVSGSMGSGAVAAYPGTVDNAKQGVLGLRGAVKDALDLDRAARSYVEFYNNVIVAFEQVLETIDGRMIGDRDGKFRFFIGHNKAYAPPGYEDDITGNIVPRLLWREIIEEWSDPSLLLDGYYKETDPVYDPTTAFEKDPSNRPGETDGKTPDPENLSSFTELQRDRVSNDMDDRLLVGFGRPRGFAAIFPKLNVPGLFKDMWENHPYSRLFPERTKHFSRLLPGIGAVEGATGFTDIGVYTSGRKFLAPGPRPGEYTEQTLQTRGTAIGSVANPALGTLTGIVEVTARDRYARARVWKYYPYGSADLDASIGTATVGHPTLILTPLPLGSFPVKADGFPDVTQLITQGGDVYDLTSGDPDLATPAFQEGQMVQYGKPDGTAYTLTDPRGNGIFVANVQMGCVVTLQRVTGAAIISSDILVSGTTPLEAVAGDTIYVVSPVMDLDTVPGDTSKPTVEDSANLARAIPEYRIQGDLKVRKQTGEFQDASLPTRGDTFPLPLQEWFGQRPPQPLSCIEGEVEFVNTQRYPAKLPCLLGSGADDSGDVQIPYLEGSKTELALLGYVAGQFQYLLGSDSTYPLPYMDQTWAAIYPNEIAIADGSLMGQDPATLYTAQSLNPVNIYVPRSAIGNLRRFDLLMVQTNQAIQGGILSVGEVTDNTIETPRFVTPIAKGDVHKYTLNNAIGYVDGAYPSTAGVILTESNPGNWLLTLDFSSLANFFLNDGNGGTAMTFLSRGALVLKFYSPDPTATEALLGVLVLSSGGTVWTYTGGSTAITCVGISLLSQNQIQVETLTSILTSLPSVSVGTYFDFAITLDCYYVAETDTYTGGGLPTATGIGSTTCAIEGDRLTFTECVSFLYALPRGTKTANGITSIEADLNLWEVQVSGFTNCTVNDMTETNGGVPFTFLQRTGPSRDASPYIGPGALYTGTFVPATSAGAGDEQGTLRVMAWEGHGNTPLAEIDNLKLSGVTSSNLGAVAPILEGVALVQDGLPALLNTGSPSVPKGDIVVIDGGVTTGTYLVRHSLEGDGNTTTSGVDLKRVNTTTNAGTKTHLDLSFPIIETFDGTTLTLSNVPRVLYANQVGSRCGFPDPIVTGSNEWVYVINSKQYATWDGSAYAIIPDAVIRAEYDALSYDEATGIASLSLTGLYQDATGNPVSSTNMVQGKQVSGLQYFPVTPQESTGLPENNGLGGEDCSTTGDLTAGFYALSVMGTVAAYTGSGPLPTGKTWQKGSAEEIVGLLSDSATPLGGNVGIRVPAAEDSTTFYDYRETAIYDRMYTAPFIPRTQAIRGVPTHVSFSSVTSLAWDTIHFSTATGSALNCLLPGDAIDIDFYGVAGVFLEPSFAKPTTDLNAALPHVVSEAYAATPDLIGLRNIGDFTTSTEESVHFSVRRIRRFHNVQSEIASALSLLKYGYELRRGTFTSYDTVSRLFTGTCTLGDLDDPNVNVNAGDVLRVLGADGELIDQAEVQVVRGSNNLVVRRPGFTKDLSLASSFEIYLKQALVPQEQSCEQLLQAITEETIVKRDVSYGTGDTDGGYVPGDFNVLKDTLVPSWSALGVQEGDYLLVDPAGTLYLPEESGVRPVGDQSVQGRSAFIAGSPADLDDNRGFYKVSATPTTDELQVDGATRFGGSDTEDIIYGSSGAEYAVLPTVNGSNLTSDQREAQAGLRTTSPAIAGSFRDRTGLDAHKSIQPFGYRIIRPSTVFSKDAVELVLFMRERTLSWIEELRSIYDTNRGGDYWIFQLENHIENVGSPTDPTEGLGLVSNLVIESVQGLVEETPFANTSDCLSILDRRFWILDNRLEGTYAEFADNGLDQRPVLPDLIDEVLNTEDRFRDQRYSWIAFRADKVNGTLTAKRRAEEQLPVELQKQQEYLNQKRGLG